MRLKKVQRAESQRKFVTKIAKRRMRPSGIARRRLLLSTARKLLRKRHLLSITMNEVAKAAKIPKGSAYFFYDSMDALFSELARQMYEELETALRIDLPENSAGWSDDFRMLLNSTLGYIDSDPAVAQLLVGPDIPPALKIAMRADDVNMGRAYDEQLASRYVLPQMHDRPKLFFLALEIVDVLCTVSMIEHGRITKEYAEECVRASLAYLRTYLPEDLPRAKD